MANMEINNHFYEDCVDAMQPARQEWTQGDGIRQPTNEKTLTNDS